jgi:Universal stress protein family
MSTSANQKAIFSKILVAIDSSDASMDAADYATAMSQRYNAELYALHVIHADVDLYWPHVTSDFTRNMRNEGEKYLNKVKVKANENDIQIKTEIISSKDISGGILDFAEENNFRPNCFSTLGFMNSEKRLSQYLSGRVPFVEKGIITKQCFPEVIDIIRY